MRPRRLPVLLALTLLAEPAGFRPAVRAASKIKIAALGDAAPGGGLFAGPSFTARPSAAGDGWVAFRAQVDDPSVLEAIMVAHVTAPPSSVQVVRLGQSAPGGTSAKFKQFLGRPAVNASGDVAFLAVVSGLDTDGTPETHSAIFVFHQQPASGADPISVIAVSGQATVAGALDLAAPLDLETAQADLVERTPALDDAGDVAFVSVLKNDQHDAAIFLRPAAGDLVQIVKTGDPYDGGLFVRVGPPALNNTGTIAFHATVNRPDAAEGIFSAGVGTAPALLVGGGLPLPAAGDQQLLTFDDQVALSDTGAVAFTGGPLVDPAIGATAVRPGCPVGDGVSGALVRTPDNVVTLLGFPGQSLPFGRVSGVALGPIAGSVVATPSITPAGTVVFYVALDGGPGGAIVRADPSHYGQLVPLVRVGGATRTPAGGT